MQGRCPCVQTRGYNASMSDPTHGVYVHLPWCAHRCHYCSFNVVVQRDPPQAAYTQALLQQWAGIREHFPAPSTLYFGGGTPSLHPVEQIAALIEAIAPSGEVTLEANPGSTSLDKLEQWRAAGVTRLSLGLQTFSERYTRFLHRQHSAEEALELLQAVSEAGFASWSADLIFALPGQTLDELDQDIAHILASGAPHVSLYGLTAHPGTHLGNAVDGGRVQLPPDEDWARAYAHILDRLQSDGLSRYEVSNFARPGQRGLHNEAYWRAQPYAGLGAGAHGCLPLGTRTLGVSDPAAFIAGPEHYESWETPDAEQRALDLLLSTLRHVDGVPLDRLQALGFSLDRRALLPHLERGTLRERPGRLQLAEAGWTLADGLTRACASALQSSQP